MGLVDCTLMAQVALLGSGVGLHVREASGEVAFCVTNTFCRVETKFRRDQNSRKETFFFFVSCLFNEGFMH